MTPYAALKKCLVDGWPNAPFWQCASMVCADFGLDTSFAGIENFVRSVKMVYMPNPKISVGAYLAACYPNTSAALFDGVSKDAAYALILQERKRVPDAKQRLSRVRQKATRENINADGGMAAFVRARELSKQHDWNTVK